MINNILFSEKQKFTQWWLWLPLLLVNVLFFLSIYLQVFKGVQFGAKSISNAALFIAALFCLLISASFYLFRLDTQLTSQGIYVRFFPFHFKYKFFPWNEISKAYVREYSPIAEYGGWGIRYSIFGKGKAYNIRGNKGLQLEFKNGKKTLIGSQNSAALNKALMQVFSVHNL